MPCAISQRAKVGVAETELDGTVACSLQSSQSGSRVADDDLLRGDITSTVCVVARCRRCRSSSRYFSRLILARLQAELSMAYSEQGCWR